MTSHDEVVKARHSQCSERVIQAHENVQFIALQGNAQSHGICHENSQKRINISTQGKYGMEVKILSLK